ncbi:MAG: hypothetical protein AB2A00_07715 [Myxococcota bacterium]
MVRAHPWWMMAVLASCTPLPQDTEPPAPPLLPRTLVAYEKMALFLEAPGQARLRGFTGAAPEGGVVEVREGNTTLAQVTADAAGRFDVRFGAEKDREVELHARVGTEDATPLRFKVRDFSEAASSMVRERLSGTGSTPNQVLFARDASPTGRTTGLVVLSGDGALDNVDADEGGRVSPLVPLPEMAFGGAVVPATPWAADALGENAWVTRYAHAGITTVNVPGGTILGEGNITTPQALGEILTLDPPVDVDGDGVEDQQVTALVPRNPTGIAVVGSRAFVAMANVLSTSASGRAQFGPGMLAVFELDGRGIPTGATRVINLAFRNPQHVIPLDNGTVAVSSTGSLQRVNGTWQVDSDGGVEIFDVSSLQKLQEINLGRFAPSRPLLLADGKSLYVPSILRARLARLDVENGQLIRGPGNPVELAEGELLRTVFECVLHPTALVFCGLFDTDSIVVVDSADDTVRPWPFTSDIRVNTGDSAVRLGIQSLAMRPGRNGVDRAGNDILVLLSLATRVSALDTRFVLGP